MYQTEYRKKLITPEQAADKVPEGGLVFPGGALTEPPALLGALARRLKSGDLKRLRTFSMLPLHYACATILAPELCDQVEALTGFVSSGERGLVSVGLDQFIPNHFHQVPRLIREKMPPDAVLTTVSPMDSAGFFSLGANNSYISAAARSAGLLIVEVNENMPRVFGDSLLHVSEADWVVENHVPLLEPPEAAPEPADHEIGRIVSEMVPDGATLQLGFGNLPNAVARSLESHRDLGIHTEVFVPAMVRLIKKGVVTGRRKTLHPLKHVFTSAVGGREMMEFMNDNPSMESYPVSYTNHPSVIARNDNMISINTVLEADLLGQCNAEHLAGRQFSGAGGQLDFVRGSYDSKGGKSILAFHSTAAGGKVSRIVARFEEGTMVTTPRMDAHYLVTEHGAADLKGMSTRERALAIIGLAHPDFREDLLREADEMRLL